RWSGRAALPQQLGTAGWVSALEAGLGPALLRSTALGLAVAAVATPWGAWVGRLLGWRLARHPRLLVVALVLPVLLPPLAVAMGLDVVVLRIGVPGEVAVLAVLAVLALPYTAFTVAAGYARLGPGPEEQARMLGAGPRAARRLVTWPALRRSLALAALLAFLVGWSDYVVTLLLGGGRLVTLPLLLGASASGAGNEPTTAALAVVAASPALVLLVVVGAVLRSARRSAPRTGPGGAA
ncbi:ABC transporter permease subunit, partial [uncultured Nocardioides sp.]|uniref:ABC transporter permease subunit n=1 Tax=uncultured Nocardioides sp. TaxID=198441 RepID=UPI002608D46D